MFRTEDEFASKAAHIFCCTEDSLIESRLFEQTFYNMAQYHHSVLSQMKIANKAEFEIEQYGENRLRITFDIEDLDTETIADFYKRCFPETQPEYYYGQINRITFLAGPFIDKVLPAMHRWMMKPFTINPGIFAYVDDATRILVAPHQPGFEKAVFVCGADAALGLWKIAQRMTYNLETKRWEYKLPAVLRAHEFKFLTGMYDHGSVVDIKHLQWDEGENKVIVLSVPTLSPQENTSCVVMKLTT